MAPQENSKAPTGYSDWEYVRYFFYFVIAAGGLVKFVFLIINSVQKVPDYIGPLVVIGVMFIVGIFISHRYYFGTWRNGDFPVDYGMFTILTLFFHCIPYCIWGLVVYWFDYMLFREYDSALESKDTLSKRIYRATQFYCYAGWIVVNILAIVSIYFDPLIKGCCLSKASQISNDFSKTIRGSNFNVRFQGQDSVRESKQPIVSATSAQAQKYTINNFGTDESGDGPSAEEFGTGYASVMSGSVAPPPPPPSSAGSFQSSQSVAKPKLSENGDEDNIFINYIRVTIRLKF